MDYGIFLLGPTFSVLIMIFLDSPNYQKTLSTLSTHVRPHIVHITIHHLHNTAPLPHLIYFTVIELSSPLPTYITSKQHPLVWGPWLWECLWARRFRATLLLWTTFMCFQQLGEVSGVAALQTNNFLSLLCVLLCCFLCCFCVCTDDSESIPPQPGACGLPHYCTPLVCAPTIQGGLAVWRLNQPKANSQQSVSALTWKFHEVAPAPAWTRHAVALSSQKISKIKHLKTSPCLCPRPV